MKKILFILFLVVSSAVLADDVAVTIYNNNLGVVSENRSFDFEKGENLVKVKDIPSLIDAGSVRFELLASGRNISILEQNYAYDLVNYNKMYAKYIDETIELIGKEGQLYSGILLSQGGNAVTLLDKEGRIKIVMLENISEVNFPALPEGLITRPTLFWKYYSDFEGSAKGNISYQTSGLSWEAEYIGLLNNSEDMLDLSGWASIDNNSGKTFKDASLKLIAGDINRIMQIRGGRGAIKSMAMAEADFGGFEEKSFFEYHMYTLPRKATLADQEKKQITLFEPAQSKVDKVFIYRPERDRTNVEVAIRFTNSKESGLGMPLPSGRVRLFKADVDGSLVLLGEDMIDHTPKDEKLNLRVGNAFDITAEEQIVNQVRISQQVEEKEFEIKLNNRKDEPVTVEIEKNLYGFWEILESSLEYEKKNVNTVIFKAPLKENSTFTLKLKVRYNMR